MGTIGAARASSGLLRVLGTAFGVSIALGNMVGSGLFRSPGMVVRHAGSLSLAALLIVACAVQSLLSANLWAEVSTSTVLSGGTVVVARRAFGDTGALIIGWTDALGCVAGTAQAAAAAAGFLAIMLPGLLGQAGPTAALLLALFALINWRGVIIGEVTQMIASGVQGLAVLVIIGLLFALARLPATPVPATADQAFVVGGALVAYQLVYGTFVGWNNAAYFTEEVTDPGRVVPRAMGWSITGFAILYLAMLLALGHALPIASFAGAAFPANVALGQAFGPKGIMLLAMVAFFILVTCTNSGIMPGSRVLFAIARVGYGPRLLTRVNRGGTPDVALFVFIAASIALVLTGRYETIFVLMGTLGMTVTTAMDVAYFALRRREPDLARPFRAIGHPVLPVCALLFDLVILASIALSDPWGVAYALAAVIVGAGVARLTAGARVGRTAVV